MGNASTRPLGVTGARPVVVPADYTGTDWDRFVADAPEATFCHLSGWRDVIENGLGHQALYAVALHHDGTWAGVLPLVRVKSALFGHYLVSMPFLNAGGAVGSEGAREALEDAAVQEARRSGADLLELRDRHASPSGLSLTQRKITVMLDLPETDDQLWKQFSAKLRSQIKRPMRENGETRFGLDERDAFYEVFSRHMRDLGTPVLSRDFFERIALTFPECAVFGTVFFGGVPVAAGCGFVWRDRFELTWASALREYSRAAPNMLLYWAFMKEMIARRIRHFDFGRCTPGGGTHRFKRQWGAQDVSLPWRQWSPHSIAAPPTPDKPVYRLAGAVWRRLPLAATNAAGPRLARLIP